jgi:predicted esterase
VAGFSSGGAFATLVALHGLVSACGFATLHGFPAGDLHGGGPKRPLLLTAGTGAEWEPSQLERTTGKLEELGWRYETKLHSGAHAVNVTDVKALVAFAKGAIQGCR